MAHQTSQRCLRLAHYHSTRHFSSYGCAHASISISRLLGETDDKNVTVNGYIRSIRRHKHLAFADVTDGTSIMPLQVLLTTEQAQRVSTGAGVRLAGSWKASEARNVLGQERPVQRRELIVEDLNVLGSSDASTYPLQKKYQTHEYLRTMPHLRPRVPFNSLMLRFRSQCIAQLTRCLMAMDFIQTHPPIITSSDCESAGEVFNVSAGVSKPSFKSIGNCNDMENDGGGFFRSPKYLTVSSQMHLEALAQAVGKVWTLSPTFRAEKSETARHLSEFYMLEAEVNFADRLEVIMDLVEDILRDLTTSMYNDPTSSEIIQRRNFPRGGAQTEQDLISTELEGRWHGMMSGNWPRITYADAIDLLQRCGQKFEHTPMWGRGLQAEHERFIATNVGKGKPVFVTHYPQKVKPFYMLATSNSKPRQQTVDCFDLLVKESCEVAGGSMREHQLDNILNAMAKKGMMPVPESLKWYIDLRRWGSVPHGGFGLGFDRLLGYLTGVSNIREVVAFPRWVGRCDC